MNTTGHPKLYMLKVRDSYILPTEIIYDMIHPPEYVVQIQIGVHVVQITINKND